MRIPNRDLPHKVTLRPIKSVGSSVGPVYLDDMVGRRALVVDKRKLVVDQRQSSESKGKEILAQTSVRLHPKNYVGPDSLVVVFAGTPHERILTVVAASYNEHPTAPNSAHLWCV